MKTFEVLITAVRTVIVQVEDDETKDDAVGKAAKEFSSLDWDVDEYTVKKELRTPAEIVMAKWHGAKLFEDC